MHIDFESVSTVRSQCNPALFPKEGGIRASANESS